MKVEVFPQPVGAPNLINFLTFFLQILLHFTNFLHVSQLHELQTQLPPDIPVSHLQNGDNWVYAVAFRQCPVFYFYFNGQGSTCQSKAMGLVLFCTTLH